MTNENEHEHEHDLHVEVIGVDDPLLLLVLTACQEEGHDHEPGDPEHRVLRMTGSLSRPDAVEALRAIADMVETEHQMLMAEQN